MSFLFIIVGQVRCLNTFSKLLDKLKLEDIIYCGYSDDIIHFSLKKIQILLQFLTYLKLLNYYQKT